jgi:hypothetical protein
MLATINYPSPITRCWPSGSLRETVRLAMTDPAVYRNKHTIFPSPGGVGGNVPGVNCLISCGRLRGARGVPSRNEIAEAAERSNALVVQNMKTLASVRDTCRSTVTIRILSSWSKVQPFHRGPSCLS